MSCLEKFETVMNWSARCRETKSAYFLRQRPRQGSPTQYSGKRSITSWQVSTYLQARDQGKPRFAVAWKTSMRLSRNFFGSSTCSHKISRRAGKTTGVTSTSPRNCGAIGAGEKE